MGKRVGLVTWVVIMAVAVSACAPEPVAPAVTVTAAAELPTLTPAPTTAPTATPTAIPSATPTEPPRPTATPAAAVVSSASLNPDAPEDVLRDPFVSGVGAEAGDCETEVEAVLTERELMAPTILYLCWPEPDAEVRIEAHRPDGGVQAGRLEVTSGAVRLAFQPRYDDPPGRYELRLTGATATRAFTVPYREANRPRLLLVPPDPFRIFASRAYGPRHNLILEGFAPGETVRLFAYRFVPSRIELIGWQEVTPGADGRLPVSVELDVPSNQALFFAAHGQQTGEVHLETVLNNLTLFDALVYADLICPGAKPSRLKMPGQARVAFTDGSPLRARAQPGFSGPAIATLAEGTVVQLRGETRCRDGSRFWRIGVDRTGAWAAEADQNVYLLEPLP